MIHSLILKIQPSVGDDLQKEEAQSPLHDL